MMKEVYKMEYYKMKRALHNDIKNWLTAYAECVKNDTPPPEYDGLRIKIVERYGVGDLSIKRAFNVYGIEVREGKPHKVTQ